MLHPRRRLGLGRRVEQQEAVLRLVDHLRLAARRRDLALAAEALLAHLARVEAGDRAVVEREPRPRRRVHRPAALARLDVREVVAEARGARVDEDAGEVVEPRRPPRRLCGRARLEPRLGVRLEVEAGGEGDGRVELDVVHRLEVELEALELDDQRARQLAQALAHLRVDLAAALDLVRVVALEHLAEDHRVERALDRRVPLHLQLDLHKVLLALRHLARAALVPDHLVHHLAAEALG